MKPPCSQQHEAAGKENKNPLSVRVCSVININCAKTVSSLKLHNWTEPRLVKSSRWYIEFYYKVPEELRPQYNTEWYRFRINHRINRYKDDTYAAEILESLKYSLEKGFNPFTDEQKEFVLGTIENKSLTVQQAMNLFLEKQRNKGLEPSSVKRYEGVVRMFLSWCSGNNLLTHPVNQVRKHHIERLLSELKSKSQWSNRQYNNLKNYLSTIFSFLLKSELIDKNPVSFIPKLKSKSTIHSYYDKKLFPKINDIIKANDPYLFYAVQFCYYLGVRSSKEMRLMKVGDILDEGKYFRFRAEATKSDRDDLIPIDPHLQKVIIEMGLLDADKKKYIFGVKKEPSDKPVNADYFSSRFAVIRKLAGLGKEFTLYGYKHTRVIHLLKAGAKLSDISKLLRHSDIATTAKYARDLHVDFNSKELERLTRKI